MTRFWALFGVVLAAGAAAAADSVPAFTQDIQPLIARHCVTCHHPGPNGAFSLQTYEDVRPRARSIATVTASRYMPPWKPERGSGEEFVGTRGLTDQEIDVIQRWVAAGAPRGEGGELPTSPEWNDGWRLGTPDLVIRMPEPFDVPASGSDIFRIFVFPIPAGPRYVKAIEFMPGTRAIHHANMRLDETRASRQLDEKDPAPGYDGLLARTAHFPDGYFFGWTPGQVTPASEDLAWRLNPGTDLVLQLHMRPTGRPERVQPAIGLYFAPGSPRLTPVMLRLGKQNIDIAPGLRDYVTTDSYVLPVDVDVHAVQPHAHYRAKEITGFATLPDGSTKGLIHIREWDFDWQDTYRYRQPFQLPKGTTVTMRYTYDNSDGNRRNPQLPPQRVHWGQNSSDEMGDLWIQVVPRSRSDLDVLTREIRQKVFREDILGYETMLQRFPDDVSLHDDVALLYLGTGRPDSAIAHFVESTRLAPGAAATHFNLGTAFVAAGRLDESLSRFREAVKLDPNYAHAHNSLGAVLMAKGQLDEAATHFQRALDADPAYAEAHNNLGKLLAYRGRADEAEDHLSRALAIRDSYPEAHYNLATLLASQGRTADASSHYRSAIALSPDWAPPMNDLAWMLATCSDERGRDPREAIRLAEKVISLTNRQDATALDVLAAAYAAAGRFDEATTSARAAANLATRRGSSAAAAAVTGRLALYQRGQSYVDARSDGPIRP